jgi:hypothetical protein
LPPKWVLYAEVADEGLGNSVRRGARRFIQCAAERRNGVLTFVRTDRGQQHHGFDLEILIAELAGEGAQLPGELFELATAIRAFALPEP